ncbi:MAG: hypothetical protein HN885_06010 [Nitrospina sp.]|nr:hypothetical protein [Nitrospina sp.]
MKKINLFLVLTMLGFGLLVQNAHAGSLAQAPNLPAVTTGPEHNARIAIAPYAQVVANDSYTFIGISHPSLATAHTSIGLVVEAMNMTTVPNTAGGRAAIFTVSAGETHRVFVVNQSHATINGNNASFTDTQTHLITTTDASQFGNIKVTSVGTHPYGATLDVNRPGRYSDTTAGVRAVSIQRYDGLNQLSMWGVVYQESNGAGFAMEFIGDMHDSTSSGTRISHELSGYDGAATAKQNIIRMGAGVN